MVASKEKPQQRKDKYNEGGTATKSMTVVDTWYWKKYHTQSTLLTKPN